MTAAMIMQTQPSATVQSAGKSSSSRTDSGQFSKTLANSTAERNNSVSETASANSTEKTKTEYKTKNSDSTRTDSRRKQTSKTDTPEKTTQTNTAEETTQMDTGEEETAEKVTDALQNMVLEILNQLQASPQELQDAMDELNLSVQDLLNPDYMQQLTVALTEGADDLSVVTDETLFNNVKELTQTAQNLLQQLSEELGMTTQETTELLKSSAEMQTTLTDDMAEGTSTLLQSLEEPTQTLGQTVTTKTESNEKQSGQETGNQQNAQDGFTFSEQITQQLKDAVTKAVKTETLSYSQMTDSIMEQIKDSIKVLTNQDSTEMELQLHPASLGSVKVSVAAKEGVITASFTTQNEAVKNAVEAQIVTLKENLNAQGIKVEAVEVTVASHAFEQNLNQNGNEGNTDSQLSGQKKQTRRISLDALSEDGLSDQSEEEEIVTDMMRQNGNTIDYTA